MGRSVLRRVLGALLRGARRMQLALIIVAARADRRESHQRAADYPSTASASSASVTSSAATIRWTVTHAGGDCPGSIRAMAPVEIPERNASAS
jgi:hypothetical protein